MPEINFGADGFTGQPYFADAGPEQNVTVATSDGNVDFSGGVILGDASYLPADESVVYGTGYFGDPSLQQSLTIDFARPVSEVSLDLLNGQTYPVTYSVEDNRGDTQTVTIPANYDGGQELVTFVGAGITSVTIGEATPEDNWDFFIDNISFTPSLSYTGLPFALRSTGTGATIGIATPGLPTDTLSLNILQAPSEGSVKLQGDSVIYTGSIALCSDPVEFKFDIKDQRGDVTPTETVIMSNDLFNKVTGSTTGNTDISLGIGVNLVKLHGNDNQVDAGAGATKVTGGGSDNTIVLGKGAGYVELTGSNNTVTLGDGIDIVQGGTDDTINLANTCLTLYGTKEMVFLGTGCSATINDYSTGIDVKIGPGAGHDVITNFAADPTGVIDLTGGIGGFTSTAQVLSALKNDGHGGVILSFSSTSSLDFTGMTLSQLHASNFQIG